MQLSFSAGAIVGDSLFFSNNSFNGLFEMRLDTGEIDYLGPFDNEIFSKELIHKSAQIYEDKIIFVPNQGDNVHIFHPDTKVIQTIPIYKAAETRYVFSDGIIFGNTLFIMPGNLEQPVVALDLDNLEYRTISTNLKQAFPDDQPEGQYFYRAVIKNKAILMAMINHGLILKFDLLHETFRLMDVKVDKLFAIQMSNGELWLTSLDSGIWKWDENNIEEVFRNNDGQDNSYTILNDINNRVYFIPDIGGEILTSSSETGRNCSVRGNGDSLRKTNRSMGFMYEFGCQYRDGVIIFPTYTHDAVFLSGEKMKSIGINVSISNELACDFKQYTGFDRKAIREGGWLGFKDFLDFITMK